LAEERKYRGDVPLHNQYGPEAKYAVEAEALLPTTKYEEEVARGLELVLTGALRPSAEPKKVLTRIIHD
jgi:agmatinase